VRGSLDQPPIIIRQTRFYWGALLAFSAIFAAAGIFILRSASSPFGSKAFAGFLLAGACGGAWRLLNLFVNPDSLILDSAGLAMKTASGTLKLAWRDIADIALIPQDPFDAPTMEERPIPTCLLNDEAAKRTRLPNGRLKLGLAWGMEPAKFIDLLRAAKARWG
jgi:hypothetical protein